MMFFPGPVGAGIYRAWNRNKQHFICPLCDYHGPFMDSLYGVDLFAMSSEKHEHCPKCGSNERARLQYLVVEKLSRTYQLSNMSLLHFAPEKALQPYLRKIFRQYDTADLENPRVNYQADLLNLPFGDQSYDFVFASHVLEHIENDRKALSEIRRVLKPGGMAVLPVPIVAVKTIEYPEPNPEECGHVRAPGPDYFERYAEYFSKVEVFCSSDFPKEYQLFNYEDRSNWPTEKMPRRKAMAGDRHLDYVPVCFA